MFTPGAVSTTGPAAGSPPPLAAAQPAGRKAAGLFSPDPNVHLFDRVAIIIKHWKAAMAVAIMVVAGMMYQTFTTVPLYRAQARIQIDEEQTTVQTDFKQPELIYSDPEPYYQTQYKILQGRELALRAVKRLKLDSVPEFDGRGATPTFLTQVISDIKAKIAASLRGETTAPRLCPASPINDNQQADSSLVRFQ